MVLAVLLDFILPLSGLLYDNLYAKSEPGWHVGGVCGFLVLGGDRFLRSHSQPSYVPKYKIKNGTNRYNHLSGYDSKVAFNSSGVLGTLMMIFLRQSNIVCCALSYFRHLPNS